ncbi:MAG: hypothetical protein WBA93_33530 [Microcoleaceae cyanobacterium]
MAKPNNQDLPKQKQGRLKCQSAKAEPNTITKKTLENTSYSKARRKRKRSNSKVND